MISLFISSTVNYMTTSLSKHHYFWYRGGPNGETQLLVVFDNYNNSYNMIHVGILVNWAKKLNRNGAPIGSLSLP